MKRRYIRPELETVVAMSQQVMDDLSAPNYDDDDKEVEDPDDILGKEGGLFGGNLWDD